MKIQNKFLLFKMSAEAETSAEPKRRKVRKVLLLSQPLCKLSLVMELFFVSLFDY